MAVSTQTKMPTAHVGTPKVSLARRAMLLACTVQPMPNDASAVKTAKRMASHFMFKPRSRAYIGPPYMRPSLPFTRYFTASRPSAYLVAIPKMPVNQHHSTAPGPPSATAVATPTMLPVPIVAASAVARAPNWLTSPLAASSFLTDSRMPVRSLRCGTQRRMVRNRWVPSRRIIMGQSHSHPLTSEKKSLIASILLFLCFYER